MGRGVKSPASALNGAVSGNVTGNSFPNRSKFGIRHEPNGGVQIVNPPDCDDDRRESRTFNVL
jgi:hypothetical protein